MQQPRSRTIEVITSVALVAAPFLFGFSEVDSARNFFIVSGIGLFLVWAVTNYKAAERPMHRMGMRSQRIHA